MAGDLISLESDKQAGEPLIQLVMQGGRRHRPIAVARRHPRARGARSRAAAGAACAGWSRAHPTRSRWRTSLVRLGGRGRQPSWRIRKRRRHERTSRHRRSRCPCWSSTSRTTSVPAARSRFRAATRSCRWSTGWPRVSRMWCSRRTGIRRRTNRSRPRIPGSKPYETIDVAYGPQILWPDHCVQGTPGARIMPGSADSPCGAGAAQGLSTARSIPIRRSTRTTAGRRPASPATCASAACGGSSSPGSPSTSASATRPRTRIAEGFDVVVIEDACRGIDVDGSMAATRQALAALGVRCISHAAVS